jgi:hypothetical protein
MQGAFLTLLLGLIGGIDSSQSVSVANSFDGVWVVSILTEKGTCPQEVTWAVTVENGAIEYSGGLSKGTLSANGNVRLRITLGSEAVIASGSVKGESGIGTWRDSSKRCSGHWTAIKD